MAVTIKSPREIELMRKAGEILAQVHEELHAAVHPGMSTLDHVIGLNYFTNINHFNVLL